jgi:hypothetical protein
MPAQRTRDTPSYSLEVITDGPQLPTLAIVSPTPRAFTFPINNNNDSPFSSPSNSPFEPDLRPLALTTCTPPPSAASTLIRTHSPTLSIESASPSAPIPATQKRRKSCSSDVERRPKKGDEDYVKRPENAFILFRRKCCEDRQQAQAEAVDALGKKQRQADLSKTISQQWKGLSAEERQYWEELAKEKKKEHEQMYPNYVYRPQRSKDKDGRYKNKKVKGVRGEYEHETDSESLSFVLPFPASPFTRRHGRSASAPTPPLPYQSIQLPNVYMPSCPTSPSLLPMIRRRSSHPNHPHASMAHFDYLPNKLMPTSFGQAGEFEASLQSTEFFPDMFTINNGQSASRILPPLQSLGMIQDQSMLFHSHQLVSPSSSIGSGSPAPSSPCSAHFTPYTPTPTQAMLSSFTQLSTSDFGQLPNVGCGAPTPASQLLTDEELQTDLQLQQDLYSSFSWESNSIWPSGGEMLLGDDFDLNAIPPIELGLPKYGDDMMMNMATPVPSTTDFGHEFVHGMEMTQQYHDENQNVDGLYGFDEMMHGF